MALTEQGIADFFRRLGYQSEMSQHELTALRQNHAVAWAVRHLDSRHEPLDPAAVALFEDAEASGVIDQDATFNMAALMQQSVQLSATKEQLSEWLPRPDVAQLRQQLAMEEAELTELELAREQMRAAKALLDRHRAVASPGQPRSVGGLPSAAGPAHLAAAASSAAQEQRAGAAAHDAAISAEAAQLEQLVAEVEGLLQSSAGSWLLCAADAEQLHALDSAFSTQQSKWAPRASPARCCCCRAPAALAALPNMLQLARSGAPLKRPARLPCTLATIVSEQLTAPQRGGGAVSARPRPRRAPLRQHHEERMLHGLSLRQVDDLHAQLALLRRGSMLGGRRLPCLCAPPRPRPAPAPPPPCASPAPAAISTQHQAPPSRRPARPHPAAQPPPRPPPGAPTGEAQVVKLQAAAASLAVRAKALQQVAREPHSAGAAQHEYASSVAQVRELTAHSSDLSSGLGEEVERFAEQNDAEVVLGEQRLLALRRQVEHERKQRMMETMLGESSRTCLLAEVQQAELETLARHERQLAGVAQLLGSFHEAAGARAASYAARARRAEPRSNVAAGDAYLQGAHSVLAHQRLPVQTCLAVLQQQLGAGGAAAAGADPAAAPGTPLRQ
jgi:hypothetical protein